MLHNGKQSEKTRKVQWAANQNHKDSANSADGSYLVKSPRKFNFGGTSLSERGSQGSCRSLKLCWHVVSVEPTHITARTPKAIIPTTCRNKIHNKPKTGQADAQAEVQEEFTALEIRPMCTHYSQLVSGSTFNIRAHGPFNLLLKLYQTAFGCDETVPDIFLSMFDKVAIHIT